MFKYVLKRGGLPPSRLIVQLLVVVTQLLLLSSYLLAVRFGRAPVLLFFPENILFFVIALAATVFLLSTHDVKLFRFVIMILCFTIIMSSFRNSIDMFYKGMYFEFILFSVFTINTAIVLSGIFTKSLIKTANNIHVFCVITTMILVSFSIMAFVMMIKYQFQYIEAAYFLSILILVVIIYIEKATNIPGFVVKIVFKTILISPLMTWGVSLLSHKNSGDSAYIFLSAALIGAISIVLDGASLAVGRKGLSSE